MCQQNGVGRPLRGHTPPFSSTYLPISMNTPMKIIASSRWLSRCSRNFFPSLRRLSSANSDHGLHGSEAHRWTLFDLKISHTSPWTARRPPFVLKSWESLMTLRTLRSLRRACSPIRLFGPQHSSMSAVCLGSGLELEWLGPSFSAPTQVCPEPLPIQATTSWGTPSASSRDLTLYWESMLLLLLLLLLLT